jgi:hypothetical protein
VVGLPLFRCADVARYCLPDHLKFLAPWQIFLIAKPEML